MSIVSLSNKNKEQIISLLQDAIEQINNGELTPDGCVLVMTEKMKEGLVKITTADYGYNHQELIGTIRLAESHMINWESQEEI